MVLINSSVSLTKSDRASRRTSNKSSDKPLKLPQVLEPPALVKVPLQHLPLRPTPPQRHPAMLAINPSISSRQLRKLAEGEPLDEEQGLEPVEEPG